MINLKDLFRNLYGDHSDDFYRQRFNDLFRPQPVQKILSRKKKRFRLSKLDRTSYDDLFEQDTVTYIDEEGPKVVETNTAHIGECGHIVGLNEHNMLESVCVVCGMVLCSKCSFLRCHNCHSIVCRRCSKDIIGTTICSRCLIGYVTKRCLSTGIKQVHKLLSTEF